MRKEVTLGMAIGGVLLVVATVAVSISHKNNKKAAGQVTLMTNGETGGAGDVASGGATEESSGSGIKAEPRAEEKAVVKAVEPKTTPRQTEVAANTVKKDPIADILFKGGKDEPPLISTNPETPGIASSEQKTIVTEPKTTERATTTEPPSAVETPAATPPSTQPAGKARTHVVQKGETFSTISAAAYGSANYYPYIMRANPKVEANRLKPGMTLNLPDASEVIPSEKSADLKSEAVTAAHKTTAAIDSAKEYKVVSGDSLNKIALTLYGKIGMVDKLYDLNKSTIGENPAALKIGMILKLPQPPTSAATAAR